MSGRLLALAEVLEPVLARLTPVAPVEVSAFEAIGLVLARRVVAPQDVPRQVTALRAGLAVASLDLAGASAHAPVQLASAPMPVAAGQPLPDGCDAVLDPAAVAAEGPFGEVSETVEPGAHVRLAGHDLATDEIIAEAGALVTPEVALAAALAGLPRLPVRRVDVALDWPDDAAAAWLKARLAGAGARLVDATTEAAGSAAIRIMPASDGPPRLALRPGDTATIAHDGLGIAVALPARFDAVVGGWCALLLPLLARLAGTSLAVNGHPLARKLVSGIGVSEVALLAVRDGAAIPLAVGDLPLGAIRRAQAFSVLAPGLEGYAAGEIIPSVCLDRPFGSLAGAAPEALAS